MLSTQALLSSSLLLLELLGLISASRFFTKAQVDLTSWASGLPTVVDNIRSIHALKTHNEQTVYTLASYPAAPSLTPSIPEKF